jgi:hypothetical protein
MDNNPAFSGLFAGNGKRIITSRYKAHTTQGDVNGRSLRTDQRRSHPQPGHRCQLRGRCEGTAGVLAVGLCGYALKTTIINCYNEANITTSGSSTASMQAVWSE